MIIYPVVSWIWIYSGTRPEKRKEKKTCTSCRDSVTETDTWLTDTYISLWKYSVVIKSRKKKGRGIRYFGKEDGLNIYGARGGKGGDINFKRLGLFFSKKKWLIPSLLFQTNGLLGRAPLSPRWARGRAPQEILNSCRYPRQPLFRNYVHRRRLNHSSCWVRIGSKSFL